MQPNLSEEKKLWRRGYDLVIGVDEVGRGAWAGPVAAAAVCLWRNEKIDWQKIGIDDSKRIRPRQRELLDRLIKEKCLAYGIGETGASQINRSGLVKATQKAIRQAVARVKSKTDGRTFVLADAFYVKYLKAIGLKNQKAIIRGDQKSISIAAASIVAKVYRDRIMRRLARKYQKYGWGRNKGYGTAEHQKAIKKYGVTRYHRLAFLD